MTDYYYYSPHTGEHIATDAPADWMGRTTIAPPSHDATQSAVFFDGAWTVAEATPEAKPVPAVVTMRQARLTLLQAGLLGSVSAAIAAMPGVEGEAARIEWEYAQEVRRDSGLVRLLVGGLGLTDAELDALFTTGAEL